MKDLSYYAKMSIGLKMNVSLECDLTLEVDGEKFSAYEVSVSNQDLLFFSEKGTLNYLVDTYGDRFAVELFNIERD